MEYTQKELIAELMRRLTYEALEFIASHPNNTNWEQIKYMWNLRYPGKSMFLKK